MGTFAIIYFYNVHLNNEEFCNISLLRFNGISSESMTPGKFYILSPFTVQIFWLLKRATLNVGRMEMEMLKYIEHWYFNMDNL